MYWLEISVTTDGEGAEAVSEALKPFAYQQCVVLEQLGDTRNLDPLALDPRVTVKIYIPDEDDGPEIRKRIQETLYYLSRLYPLPAPVFRELKEQDWAAAWKKNYRPFKVGKRLWIQPSWDQVKTDDVGDLVVTIDPGMAFGTGLHPSTKMCLEALETLVRPGHHILDVGTGSGILAIAAARLGAEGVVALDRDRTAVSAAKTNIALNSVQDRIAVFQGMLASVKRGTWDLVVVNILAPVIRSLLVEDDLLDYVNDHGRIILGGLVGEQAVEIEREVRRAGGRLTGRLSLGDWGTIVASH